MTITEALEKLLGLKWEERKQPMRVVVIDHIESLPKISFSLFLFKR